MNNLTSLNQEEDDEAVIIIVALALLGKRVPIRTMRTYLTRPDLTGNPRGTSAWNHLRAVGNDRAFITVMGVDVRTFEALLVPFSIAWDSTTITRSDVNPNGEPQPARRSLDASGGLALLLHWLSSSMAAYTLQQIFSITAAVCTRNLQHARGCLLAVLRDLKIGRISWPSSEENCQYYSSLIERKYPLLVKCFGFIDGLNLPVNVADNEECVLCLFFLFI
jgi:hypothetical protein